MEQLRSEYTCDIKTYKNKIKPVNVYVGFSF